jgi:SNF2 family DNA or RNA helicase
MVEHHHSLLLAVANGRSQGTVRATILEDSMSPFDLRSYDVVVTSYTFLTSEAARLAEFPQHMEDYKQGKTNIPPTRPRVILLSGIWTMNGAQHIGRFLAFDEAHTIRNHAGRAYAAAKRLRDLFKVCILSTGTMLDNSWTDAFALVSLLRGHPFTSMLRMREIFTDGLQQNPRPKNLNGCVPKGVKLERLVHFLHACALSRPSSTMMEGLGRLTERVISFDLAKGDRKNSNKAFAAYEKSKKTNSDNLARGGHADRDGEPRIKWEEQIKAAQLAFHPSLPKITAEIEFKPVQLLTPLERVEWEEWRNHIREGENCLSERVDVVIDLINQARDRRPGDSILIMDQSAFFLDILHVAVTTMDEPVPVFKYTDEQDPAERQIALTEFVASAGTRTSVMLATRAAGLQESNFQAANVVIRCGPWSKRSWEQQAVALCHRYGQTKPVWSYELKANDCDVEAYKRRTREARNVMTEAIMKLVTIKDGAQLPVWSEQLPDE